MQKNKIHILGTPMNPSIEKISIDPFARTAYFLTTFLHREKWNVNYYGYDRCEVECSKKINVVDLNWREEVSGIKPNEFKPAPGDYKYAKAFSEKAIPYLKDNLQKGDIVLCTWTSQCQVIKTVCDKIGAKVVDAHIGHYFSSKYSYYHVYAGDALRSWTYGKEDKRFDNRWTHVTIPPMASSIEDYTYSEKKQNHFLFMSRLITNKGLGIVLDMAKNLPNEKFKIAGPGDINYWEKRASANVEFIGFLGVEERRKELSEAKAVLTPALYFEPFGLTSVEAAVSGTPLIASNWGGYTDNIIDGVTGYRCSNLYSFLEAAKNVHLLSSKDCFEWGKKHTAEFLIKKWNDYIIDIARDGWYDIRSKKEIEKLYKI